MVFSSLAMLFSGLTLMNGFSNVSSAYSFTKQNVDNIYIHCEFAFSSIDITDSTWLSISYVDNNNQINSSVARFGNTHITQSQLEFDYGYHGGESNTSFYFKVDYTGVDTDNSDVFCSPMIYEYRLDSQTNGEMLSFEDSDFDYVVECNIYWLDLDQYNYFKETEASNTDAYNSGYQDGYSDGFQVGKDEMNRYWQAKYDNDIQSARDSGYQSGYVYGLEVGRGQVHADYGFTNLFLSIADTPVLMFRRLFDFSVFGTSILAVVMSLFTCILVIHIVKKIVK